MPFFSFSLKDSSNQFKSQKIENNKTYFSKNTTLWKKLSSKKLEKIINHLQYEERKKIGNLKKNILFCLPPSIGLGDAIEYGLAIKSISESNKFKKIGVAFADKYSFIFKKKFNIKFLYPILISENDLNSFDNIFHFTLEVESLRTQKYLRSDIVLQVCNFFNVPQTKFYENKYIKNKKIKKISIFPISTSSLRTMPINVINELLLFLKNKIKIEIFLDDNSDISKIVEKNLIYKNYIKKNPKNLNTLIKSIEEIDFGIFVDSGPLHVAKLLGKKGILLETSVSGKVLLNNYKKIKLVKNTFSSNFCNAACGLVDIFSFNNKVGCYSSISINQKEILSLKNFNSLQRREVNKNNLFYLLNPVGCVKTINIKNIKNLIKSEVF